MFIRILIAVAVAGVGSASAQPKDPNFKYAPSEEVAAAKDENPVEWKAEAQAGFLLASGNSKSTTLSASAKTSRKAGMNKVEFEGATAFARASAAIADDINANGTIDSESEIISQSKTSTKSFLVRGRYDRFLTEKNSLYAVGSVSGDEPAGKKLVGGGQAGYSRLVYGDDVHTLVSEVGYDFSYEDFVVGDSVEIHSGRVFASYEGKVATDSTVGISGEGLANVNKIQVGATEAKAFKDNRFNGKFTLTTKLFEDISFRFSFVAKFDNVPAPRAPLNLPYAAGFSPAAEKLDTLTEVSLIINFI